MRFVRHTTLDSAPTLATERLVLRAHRPDDFDDCLAMLSDPAVYRYISGQSTSRSDVWSKLLRYIGHWAALGFGYWVVSDKLDGRFLGEVGFANYQREIEPSLQGIPEIGWALLPVAQGRGLAMEAVSAIIAWGDEHFETPTTACMIAPENTPSIRLAEKVGYALWTKTVFADQPTLLYRRQRD